MLSTFEKSQAEKIRDSFNVNEDILFSPEERESLFKSQFDKDIDSVLGIYDSFEKSLTLPEDALEKSEDTESKETVSPELLEKGLKNMVHKYIKKVGSRYYYDIPADTKVKPLNELRDYHHAKTSLDSIKRSLDGAKHSEHIRDAYKLYNQKAGEFQNKYGFPHHSPEADRIHRLTVAGMINAIDNRVAQNEAKRTAALNGELNQVADQPMANIAKGRYYEQQDIAKAKIASMYSGHFEKSDAAQDYRVGFTQLGKPIYKSGLK